MDGSPRHEHEWQLNWETSTPGVLIGLAGVALIGWFALRGSDLAVGLLVILGTILFVVLGIFLGAWYSVRNLPPVHELREVRGHSDRDRRDWVIEGVRMVNVEAGSPVTEVRSQLPAPRHVLPPGRRHLERGGHG